MTRRVYAAGPLFQCSPVEATGWRQELKLLLGEKYVCDPATWGICPDESQLSKAECIRLMNADLHQLNGCDALIYNAWKPSWGSAMEAFYAYTYSGFIVSIKSDPVPAWLRAVSDHVVTSVSEAARLTAEYLDLKDAPILKGVT